MSRASGVHVYVRCRDASRSSFDVNTNNTSTIVPRRYPRQYSFDGTFESHVTQREIFERVAQPLVIGLMAGISATIFAYGQTGTGKTYTISGTPSDPGLVPRCIQEIFTRAGTQSCGLGIQYVELYNEQLYDLLSPKRERCRLVEDRVVGADVRFVTSYSAALKVVEEASERRSVAYTDSNADSSRSHAVLTFNLVMGESAMVSKLHLVDLAGSENVIRSGSLKRAPRQREAVLINQSLLSLGRVISALVVGSEHIPYRESKLTRLLRDSLGGSTQTSMIATVSLRPENEDETLQTLEYAAKTKRITNKPQPVPPNLNLREMVMLLERTQRDLDAQRRKDGGIYLETTRFYDLERGFELAQSLDAKLRARELETEKLQAENILLKQRYEAQQAAISAAYGRVVSAADAVHASAGDNVSRASSLESLIHELVNLSQSTLTELQSINAPTELGSVSAWTRRQVRVEVSRAVESAQKGITEAFDAFRVKFHENVNALEGIGPQVAGGISLLETSLRNASSELQERENRDKEEARDQIKILEAQMSIWKNRLDRRDLKLPVVPSSLSSAGPGVMRSVSHLKQAATEVQNPTLDLGDVTYAVDNALRGVQDAADNHRVLSTIVARSGERLKTLSSSAVPSLATQLRNKADDINQQASVVCTTVEELAPLTRSQRSEGSEPNYPPPNRSPAKSPQQTSPAKLGKRTRNVLRPCNTDKIPCRRKLG